MLIKSIKHDILATYRDFVALYLVLLLMAVSAPLILATRLELLTVLLIISFAFISIAIMVVTFISIVRLYSRRLYSNEGYLTLTLPVSTLDTLIAKIVTGLIWSITTFVVFVVAFLAFSLMFWVVFNASDWNEITTIFRFITEFWNSGYFWTLLHGFSLQIPMMLTTTVYSLTLLIFIVTLVNTSFVHKHRLPIGVLTYYVASNVITLVLAFFTTPFAINNIPIDSNAMMLGGLFVMFDGEVFVIDWLQYGTQIALYILIIAGLGYGSWWLVEKKLEIE
jgi:hypothetical protein